MRLIDKDELLTKVDKEWGLWVEVVNVMYAPEVNAIPIEWIKKWNQKNENFFLYMGLARKLIEDWEKENENN